MLYGRKKKSPRARPLVNDLRVKPTAAAAQAAAASAPREDARVDVDVGGRGAPPGRVARGAGLAGGASAGVSSGPSRGRRRRRCCLRGPGHVGCFFFPPPLPPPCSLLGRGGDRSNQSGRGLLFAYRSVFFFVCFVFFSFLFFPSVAYGCRGGLISTGIY